MSSTTETKRTDYAARQQMVSIVVVPAVLSIGATLSWFAASGESFLEIAFLFFFVYQTTLAAIWIGFRRISLLTQFLLVFLLVAEGLFAAREYKEGLLNLLLREPGWALASSSALVICCRLWNLWYTIDSSYMRTAEVKGHEVVVASGDVQFGIRHILVLIGLVAYLALVVPWLLNIWVALDQPIKMLLIYLAIGSIQALIAIWAVLSLSDPWLRGILMATVVFFLFCFAEESTIRSGDYVVSFLLGQYLALLAYLAVCRWCGHRLVAWPRMVGISWSYGFTDQRNRRSF